MPFAEHFMLSGTVKVTSALQSSVINVPTGFLPSKIIITNETQWGATGTGNENIQQLFWDSTNTSNTNITFINAAGTALVPSQLTSNGISLYDGHAASPTQLVLGPKISGTSITKASGTFTVSSTATLFPGATILVTNRASATTLASTDPALGGMFFTVNTVPGGGTTFTIANSGNWLNTASFTGGSENFNVQLVTTPSLYYPYNAQIVFISAANPMVVTTSTNTNLTIGQQVKLKVPKYFAMTQADGLSGVVTAVSGNQVTIGGIDSSAFTAFAWNNGTAGTSSVPYTPATLIPMGAGPTTQSGPPTVTYQADLLDDATDNQAFQGFSIGTSITQASAAGTVGVTANDVLSWTAWRADL